MSTYKIKIKHEEDYESQFRQRLNLIQRNVFYNFDFDIDIVFKVVTFYFNKGFVERAPIQQTNLFINYIKNSCNFKWTLLNYKNIDTNSIYDEVFQRWFKERIQIKEDQLEFIHEDSI